MIHDAKVEVTCDGPNCSESIEVELPFNYPDYSGKGGRYDHRPQYVNPLIKAQGWSIGGDDTHYCETHANLVISESNEDEEDN